MACEGHFASRAENAKAIARSGPGRREYEGGLGKSRPARYGLHVGFTQPLGIKYNRQWVACAGAVGEDIELRVAA